MATLLEYFMVKGNEMAQAKKCESFPYILIKSSEPRNFCTAELLSFTVYVYT